MQLSKEETEAIWQAGRHSLEDFSVLTNPYYKANWHHSVLAKKLEQVESGKIKRLIIEMPPRHGKTQLATINFPAWYLGRNPTKQVITASYSGDLAMEFGGKTRDLVNSEEYHEIFNLKLKEDEKSRAKWLTDKKGSYTSVGVGGSLTGRGANILIIDDPIKNREEADSEVYRNKTWNWYTSTAYTRLEKDAAVIIILTRWNLDDIVGRILNETSEDWEVLRLPAIAEVDEQHRKKGEALWEDKYDLKALEVIKQTIGTYDWSALYQQTPILSELQEFKESWFKPRDQEEVDKLNTRKFLTIDTAISQKASADYTGICDNSVDSENFWNLKAWRVKINPKELIDLIFTLHAKRGYEVIGIEKTIYLDALKPFIDEEMRKRDKFLPIVELHHRQTAKEVRIRGLIPRYESGSIFHIKGECNRLEEELLLFPQSVNDDVSDATAYQLQIAESEVKEETEDFNLYNYNYS